MKKLLFTLIILTVTAAFVSCGVTSSDEIDSTDAVSLDTAIPVTEDDSSTDLVTEEAETEAKTEEPKAEEPKTYVAETEDFRYYFSGISITILKYIGDKTDVIIPEEIDGYPVLAIKNNIFSGTKAINVTVPGTIKTVPTIASDQTEIESVILSEGILKIGSYAFDNSQTLKKLTIPKSVTSIDSYAINECNSLEVINYGGKQDKLYDLLDKVQLWRYYHSCKINYYNDYFEKYIEDPKTIPLDFWLDREAVMSAELSLDNVWEDHYSIVEAYAEALYPEYGKATEDGGNVPDLYLCRSQESYDNYRYDLDIETQYWNVIYENGVKKTFMIYEWESDCMYDENGKDTWRYPDILVGIEECVDGVIYNTEYFLDYLKKDPRFSDVFLAKQSENILSHSEEITSLNLSTIPGLEAIITQYPCVRGYQHTIDFYENEKNDIHNVTGLITVTTAEKENKYYSFSIDLLSGEAANIVNHETIEDFYGYIDYEPNGSSYETENEYYYYDSEILSVYRDKNSDVYAQNKKSGEKHLIFDGLTDDEEQAIIDKGDYDDYPIDIFKGFGLVKVYDDRYVIYNIIGWEWICGFGIYDTETGAHYYDNHKRCLLTRGEKVFVASNHEDFPDNFPDMSYLLLSEYKDGAYEFHDIPSVRELTDSWSMYSVSSDGEWITVMMHDNEDRLYKIITSGVDSAESKKYFISKKVDYDFILDGYFIFSDTRANHQNNNYGLDAHIYLIPIK